MENFESISSFSNFEVADHVSCRHVASLIMLKYTGHIESNCAIWATILFQLHLATSNKRLSASLARCCSLSFGQHVVLTGNGGELQALSRQLTVFLVFFY